MSSGYKSIACITPGSRWIAADGGHYGWPRYFQRRADAVAAARAMGLSVDKRGVVTSA